MIPRTSFRRAALWLAAALALPAALVAPARAVSSTVVISAVLLGDETSGSSKFVQLRNLTGADIDLTGWTIHKKSASGSDAVLATLNGTIPANCYYLIVSATYNTKHPDQKFDNGGTATDANFPSGSASSGGSLGLMDASATLVDAVAMRGAATVTLTNAYVEGTPVVFSQGVGTTYQKGVERLPHGVNTQDSDDNSSDFVSLSDGTTQVYTIVPKSSADCGQVVNPPALSAATFNPSAVDPGDSSILSVTVTPGTNPTISSVTADLTSVGGSATAALTHGTGNSWSTTVAVSAATAPGSKDITITATDAGAKTGTAHATLNVNVPGGPITIAQLRTKAVDGTTTYAAHGIVIANNVNTNGVYFEDATGAAGMMIFGSAAVSSAKPVVGDDITVNGTLQYYNGATEFLATTITVNSSGNPVPAPLAVTLPQAEEVGPAPDYVHPKEGLLVTLTGLSVASVTTANQNYVLKDASGNTIVLYVHKNTTANAVSPYPGVPANPIDPATIMVGNQYNITGVLTYFKSGTGPQGDPAGFEILPRSANDMTLTGQSVIVTATADPTTVARGSSTTLAVTTNPASGSTVTADLSAFGGSATTPLAFDGSAYTYTLNVPSGAPLGINAINVTASNPGQNGGQPLTAAIKLTVISAPVAMTIAQARQAPDFTGVILTGTVTNPVPGPAGTFYLQDATGGAYFFDAKNTAFSGVPGDSYTVQGFKTTYQGAVEIDYTGQTPDGPGIGDTINPVAATNTQWPSVTGKLATTMNLVITGTRAAGTNKVYEVTDGTSTGEIFIASTNTIFTAADTANYIPGSAWTVTGVVDRYTSTTMDVWQVKPRTPSDFATGSAPGLVPAKLAFTTEPGGGLPGAAISPSPVVTVQTSAGATVTTFTGPVTLALKSGTGTAGAVLGGTATVNAVNGVASFGPLSVDLAGTGYVLNASSGWLPVQASAAFTVGAPSVPGDIDKSGTVDANDVRLALKVAAGLVAGNDPSVSFDNGDVVKDNAITTADAVAIRKLF